MYLKPVCICVVTTTKSKIHEVCLANFCIHLTLANKFLSMGRLF